MAKATLKELRTSLESLVKFSQESLSLAEVVDEVRLLSFLLEKNGKMASAAMMRELTANLRCALLMLERLEDFLISAEGSEKAVSESFKALVYATVEQVALRLGISASSASSFTFFTNVVSFILHRVSEYSYVKAAKNIEASHFRKAKTHLSKDLWELAVRNSALEGISIHEGKQYKAMIAQVSDAIDQARSQEAYIQLYAFLSYIYLLKVLDLIDTSSPASA
ncbi:MAG: hypothetical protein RDV48_21980 [Candidatus Eremiobacteraeota bacterium]|nr:hypothetical protein [Candidatus Eremiobacteraeota bacterium]